MPLATILLIVQILAGLGGLAVDFTKIKAAFEKLGLKPTDEVTPEHVAAAMALIPTPQQAHQEEWR